MKNANITRHYTRTIFPLRSKIAGELGRYIHFIKSKTQPILSESEVVSVTHKIKNDRLTPSFKTNREHVKHVKEIIATKAVSQICPKCGSEMVLRKIKKGKNAGDEFWGCSKFPKCRGIVKRDPTIT